MTLVVLDANVLASGLLGLVRRESVPGELTRRWSIGQFQVATSEELITEVEQTLAHPFFLARISPEAASAALEIIRRESQLTILSTPVRGVATHSEDDHVLSLAVSAAADYLVTGDRELQRLGRFEGVQIVSPREFLAILDQ